MACWPRFVRNYQRRIDISEVMILVTMGVNLTQKNAHP